MKNMMVQREPCISSRGDGRLDRQVVREKAGNHSYGLRNTLNKTGLGFPDASNCSELNQDLAC